MGLQGHACVLNEEADVLDAIRDKQKEIRINILCVCV